MEMCVKALPEQEREVKTKYDGFLLRLWDVSSSKLDSSDEGPVFVTVRYSSFGGVFR